MQKISSDRNKPDLVSVIIPFYSELSGFLIKSVESALQQTHNEVEVIVVDDASPIRADEELANLNDVRVRIIRHEINRNGAIARNAGIKNAKGEFVAFLDYDDIWLPSKLREQLCEYKRHGSLPKNIIYCRCRIEIGKRTLVRPAREIMSGESVGSYLFCSGGLIQTSGIFMSREIASKILFDDLRRHQDYQYCLALESAGCRFILCKNVLYNFTQMPKTISYIDSEKWCNAYLADKRIKKCFMKNVVIRNIAAGGDISLAISYAKKYGISLVKTLNVIIIQAIKKTLRSLNII